MSIFWYVHPPSRYPHPPYSPDGMRCYRSDWPVLLFSTLVCFQPTELILGFFCLFHKLSYFTLTPPPQNAGPISSLALHANGRRLLVASTAPAVHIVDTRLFASLNSWVGIMYICVWRCIIAYLYVCGFLSSPICIAKFVNNGGKWREV